MRDTGIGLCNLLGVVFVTLKLCDVIHWSWWWVTLPFWAPLLLVASVVLAAVFCLGLGLLMKAASS